MDRQSEPGVRDSGNCEPGSTRVTGRAARKGCSPRTARGSRARRRRLPPGPGALRETGRRRLAGGASVVVAAAVGNRDAMGKTFEAWDDDSLPPGAWVGTFAAIARD